MNWRSLYVGPVPRERLDVLLLVPLALNLLWAFGIAPAEPWGWLLTALMLLSLTTFATSRLVRWRRSRHAAPERVPIASSAHSLKDR